MDYRDYVDCFMSACKRQIQSPHPKQGRLKDVEVDIDPVKKVHFEVIDIIDDTKAYSCLLGIDQDIDNLATLNLKKRKMMFEFEDLRVFTPLDPNEGDRYIESVREDLEDITLYFFIKVIT